MLFSLILPVYGVEKYIEKCIKSCCEQKDFDSKDFELIIVDDSTPDSSLKIAESILKEYPEINYRIIHRPNGGLSAARNTGIDSAKGEYLWFIDSDDFISHDSLRILADRLRISGYPEILSFSHINKYQDSEDEMSLPDCICNKEIHGIGIIEAIGFYSAWARIYSSRFIKENDLRFKEGILWEDGEFNLRALSICSRHYAIRESLYFYVRRPGSISTSGHITKTLESYIYKFDALWKWIDSHDFSQYEIRVLNMRNNETILCLMAGIYQVENHTQRRRYFRFLKERQKKISTSFGNSTRSRDKSLGILIKWCPRILSILLRIRMKQILKRDTDRLLVGLNSQRVAETLDRHSNLSSPK